MSSYYDDKGNLVLHVTEAHKRKDIPETNLSGKCPKCGTEEEMGYGFAGGGLGVYSYCPNEKCEQSGEILSKTEDKE